MAHFTIGLLLGSILGAAGLIALAIAFKDKF